MNKTSEYRVIYVSFRLSTKKAVEKLEHAVEEAIRTGWEPLGGVTFSAECIAQAMVRSR